MPTDPVAAIEARLRELDDQIAPLAAERDRLETALDAISGVRTDVGTSFAQDDGVDENRQSCDARLPSARIPSSLLARIWATVGKRGYSLFIRGAVESELSRIEARNKVRTTAK